MLRNAEAELRLNPIVRAERALHKSAVCPSARYPLARGVANALLITLVRL